MESANKEAYSLATVQCMYQEIDELNLAGLCATVWFELVESQDAQRRFQRQHTRTTLQRQTSAARIVVDCGQNF